MQIEQIAESQQIGALSQTFQTDLSKLRRESFSLAFFSLPFGAYFIYSLYSFYTKTATWEESNKIILAFSAFFFLAVIGGLKGIYDSFMPPQKVYVFEKGIIDCKTKKPQPLRYDNVENISQSIHVVEKSGQVVREDVTYTLESFDGLYLSYNEEYKDIKTLGNILLSQVTNCQLVVAIAKLENGEDITFAARLTNLKINQQGITIGSKFLNWNDCKMEIHNGKLQILHRKDNNIGLIAEAGWGYWGSTIDVGGFKNFSLFYELVGRFCEISLFKT